MLWTENFKLTVEQQRGLDEPTPWRVLVRTSDGETIHATGHHGKSLQRALTDAADAIEAHSRAHCVAPDKEPPADPQRRPGRPLPHGITVVSRPIF